MQQKPMFKKLRKPNEDYYVHFSFKSDFDSDGYMFEQNQISAVFELLVKSEKFLST